MTMSNPDPTKRHYTAIHEMLAALASIGITPNTEPNEEPWLTLTEPMGEEPAATLADALATMQDAAAQDGHRRAMESHALYVKRAVFDAASQAMCECLRLHREGVPADQWRVDHNAVLAKALEVAERASLSGHSRISRDKNLPSSLPTPLPRDPEPTAATPSSPHPLRRDPERTDG